MPRTCSVYGCKSNYKSEKEFVTTYSIPKQEPERSKWLQHIPTDLSKLKNPVVCIKHFHESCVIRTDSVRVGNEIKEFTRKIPKLKDGSVPTIFPNTPAYLSSVPSTSKRLPDVESENLAKAMEESLQSYQTFLKEKEVINLDSVRKYCMEKPLNNKWSLVDGISVIALCLMDISAQPIIQGSIKIFQDLTFQVFLNNNEISVNKLPKKKNNLKDCFYLEELFNFVEKEVSEPNDASKLTTAIKLIKDDPSFEESTQLQFFVEQLSLSLQAKEGRRYHNNSILLGSTIYSHSPASYKILQKSGFIYLPHPRNMEKLICSYDLFDSSIHGSIHYLKTKMAVLKEHDLLVNILLDEIYVDPQFSLKGGSIIGSSQNDPSKAAKTAQVFMISSVLSNYKDIVGIIPITCLTSQDLLKLILTVIREVEGVGFKVICLISDNNNVNRKAFELMSPAKFLQPSVPHPFDPSRKLFIIFDTVHILKCVRNNWISKHDDGVTFIFPAMGDDALLRAQFKHLRDLYYSEKNSVVKYGHLLSSKAIHPNSIQRQNVKLALKIFDEKNIAALRCVGKFNPESLSEIEQTCIFIDIFVKWWKIVNCRSPYEGQRFNDPFREPIRLNSSSQLDFLKKMLIWLKNWRVSVPIHQALSAQTFQALITTTEAFLMLISHIFDAYRVDYLLLGKFQTDNLESRFGLYRQLSGSNFYISYMQVLESERRLRFRSAVLLSSKHADVPLKTLLPKETPIDPSCNIDLFVNVIAEEFSFEIIPQPIWPILTYIGGYAAMKSLRAQKCNTCSLWLQLDKTVEVNISQFEYELIMGLDRGKMTLPTQKVVEAVALVWQVLKYLLDNHYNNFISTQHQLSILHKLSIIHLNKNTLPSPEVCDCQNTLQNKLESICLLSSKIMLNNFVKLKNDKNSDEVRKTAKIKKLKGN